MSIDYGLGMTNIDKATGIRYGVIHQNEVLQAWADSSEAYYGEPDTACCPKCGSVDPTSAKENGVKLEWGDDVRCGNCGEEFQLELGDFAEPLSFYVDDGQYLAEQDNYGDIFITKSPYYTLCDFCSPCAPGAGYLMNEGNVKAYCFNGEWFENGKAPYKVYSVETGEEVAA